MQKLHRITNATGSHERQPRIVVYQSSEWNRVMSNGIEPEQSHRHKPPLRALEVPQEGVGGEGRYVCCVM